MIGIRRPMSTVPAAAGDGKQARTGDRRPGVKAR